jgi:hypothetical protein
MRLQLENIAILVAIAATVGCEKNRDGTAEAQTVTPKPQWTATLTIRRIDRMEDVEGYWALNDEWTGFMGLALELKENRFRYWFYSDVRSDDQPKYPIEGKFSIEHGILVLGSDATRDPKQHVYDTKWLLITHDGQDGLFPYSAFETIAMRRESPRTRMLFPVTSHSKWPVYNAPVTKD